MPNLNTSEITKIPDATINQQKVKNNKLVDKKEIKGS